MITISFKKTVSEPEVHWKNEECNDTRWGYKVSSANAKINTKVSLDVPDDVWILSIKKKTEYSKASLIEKIENVFQFSEGGSLNAPLLALGNKRLVNGSHTYFFTRPGDRLELSLSVEDQSLSNASALGSYQVDFLGANRCKAKIEEFGGWTPAAIRKAATDVANGMGLHDSILYFSCLTNQKHILKLLNTNQSYDVKSILETINDLKSRVIPSLTSVNSNTRGVLRLVLKMAEYSVAQTLVEDVKKYCSDVELVDVLSGRVIGTEKRFDSVNYALDRLNAVVQSIVPQYHRVFAKRLQDLNSKGVTYAQAIANDADKAEFLSALKIVGEPRIYLIDEVRRLMELFPDTETSKLSRHQVLNNLTELEGILFDIYYEIDHLVVKLVHKDSNILEYRLYKDKSERALVLIDQLQRFVDAEFKTFHEKDNVSGFTELAQASISQYLKANFENLRGIYGGFLNEFLASKVNPARRADVEKSVNETFEQVNQCLN